MHYFMYKMTLYSHL